METPRHEESSVTTQQPAKATAYHSHGTSGFFQTKSNNTMNEFCNNLTIKDYEAFREAVISETGCTRSTWHYWRTGQNPTANNRQRINTVSQQMFGRNIFNE